MDAAPAARLDRQNVYCLNRTSPLLPFPNAAGASAPIQYYSIINE
jgi:hypothetical protein